ncbi:MAG: hypothetical protein M1819_003402 [Sarea resinae]|nr:MAG: hypothetical protein M1819_003402 [Sarea resinae]
METLREQLQRLAPLTHNLPPPVQDAAISLLGPECYKTLVLELDPTHTECVKLGISKGLGLGIIAASSIVKLPQLLKLLSTHSSQGVSFLSYLLETSAYLITLAYNVRQGFPASTYGETALIAVQNVVIAVLVLHFSGKSAAAGVFVAGLAGAGYALFKPELVNGDMLAYAQAGAGVLGIASKAPQIYTIWKQGGTGQLSAFAVFNYLAGSLARIFTTLQEVDDPLILYGYLAGFALNLVLALQMVWYWNAPAATTVKSKSGKKAKKISAAAASPSTSSMKTRSATSSPSPSAGGKGGKGGKSPSTRRRG